jgi:hypothetical protein|tara:strand:- start:212 stop:457 length:246 start_codon:yes stop_codon:yes gene_type:complete
MSLNKSKEITKKNPEVKAIFTAFLDSIHGKKRRSVSRFAKKNKGPHRFLVGPLFLGEYALEKFYSANHLIPRRHPKHECPN